MNWIKEMFENKGVNKEASQTDATQEFNKKVKASGWVDGVMGIDEPAMAKEAEAKMEAEIAVKAEAEACYECQGTGIEDLQGATNCTKCHGTGKKASLKTAAYEAFQTTEEVLKQDYSRDVEILSDFTLASMIAEVRGHAKQDFPENATEYFEKAKKDVKSDRKAVEKELLNATGMSAQLDWRKSFSDYKKDETPKQATEKELYNPKLDKVDDKLSEGAKVGDYAETDKQHIDSMQGVGREEKERTEVTQQAGEVHKDAALVRDPETELKVGTIIRLARSIMSHEGQILAEGTNWEITNIDGYHYRLSANGQTHVISSHDTPKFNKIASQEIENQASREQVLEKIAEIKSPWAVVEKDGKEVIALVVPENKNTKESEEDKKDLNK